MSANGPTAADVALANQQMERSLKAALIAKKRTDELEEERAKTLSAEEQAKLAEVKAKEREMMMMKLEQLKRTLAQPEDVVASAASSSSAPEPPKKDDTPPEP